MTHVETIGDATLYLGDCREVLASLAPDSVDAIVTDPPYGLSFMGSGSTGLGAYAAGMKFIGIERELKYLGIRNIRLISD